MSPVHQRQRGLTDRQRSCDYPEKQVSQSVATFPPRNFASSTSGKRDRFPVEGLEVVHRQDENRDFDLLPSIRRAIPMHSSVPDRSREIPNRICSDLGLGRAAGEIPDICPGLQSGDYLAVTSRSHVREGPHEVGRYIEGIGNIGEAVQRRLQGSDCCPLAPNPSYRGSPSVRFTTYKGDSCLETFVAKFENISACLRWNSEDRLFHLRASLEGPAGQILWDAGQHTSAEGIIRLLRSIKTPSKV